MAKGSKKTKRKPLVRKPLTVSVHGEKIDLELTLAPGAFDSDGDGFDEMFEKLGAMFNRSNGVTPMPVAVEYSPLDQTETENEEQFHERIAKMIERFAGGMCDHMLERGSKIFTDELSKRAAQVS